VEQYHAPLRRVYKIISLELEDTSEELTLQIAIKAVNDSASLDRLIPILLVFSAYPQITNDSLLSPSIIQRAKAIRKAIKEVRRLYTTR